MPLVCNGIKSKTDDKSNGLREPALIFLRIFQLYMIFQLRIKEKIWGLSTAPKWHKVKFNSISLYIISTERA